MTMRTAGKRVGCQIGRAAKADAAGSAGKRQPPAAREARDGRSSRRATGSDLRQRGRIVQPVLPVAAEKLETHASTIETGKVVLELR